MTNESVALVVNKLEALSLSIGVGVKEMFPYFVKQQYIDSLSALLPLILLIIVLPLFVHFYKKTDWSSHLDNFNQPLTLIFGMLSIIFIIGTLVVMENDLLKFLNPEYHAIREIISLIR